MGLRQPFPEGHWSLGQGQTLPWGRAYRGPKPEAGAELGFRGPCGHACLGARRQEMRGWLGRSPFISAPASPGSMQGHFSFFT